PAVVDRKAAAFEEVLRLQTIRTDMVGHHHAIEDCLFHAVPIASVPWYGGKPWPSPSENLPPQAGSGARPSAITRGPAPSAHRREAVAKAGAEAAAAMTRTVSGV